MDLPDHYLAAVRSTMVSALEAAEVDRVRIVGRIDPRIHDVLDSYSRSTGRKLEKVDCAHCVQAGGFGDETCAWILPEVPNYYDAYRQLGAIRASCLAQAIPMLVLAPHLAGAVARRDYYFDYSDVPEAWRHPVEACEVRGEPAERAIAMGGLRNGALTAIEDFSDEQWDQGASLAWTRLPAVGGLCALFDVDADWAAELACCLARFHNGTTLAAMSEGELREYLATVDRPSGRTGSSVQ